MLAAAESLCSLCEPHIDRPTDQWKEWAATAQAEVLVGGNISCLVILSRFFFLRLRDKSDNSEQTECLKKVFLIDIRFSWMSKTEDRRKNVHDIDVLLCIHYQFNSRYSNEWMIENIFYSPPHLESKKSNKSIHSCIHSSYHSWNASIQRTMDGWMSEGIIEWFDRSTQMVKRGKERETQKKGE